MPESNLSLTYHDIRVSCGHRFGYGRDPGEWSENQANNVAQMIDDGLRLAYRYHEWRFLRPRGVLTTSAGDDTYDAPDDFAALDGVMTYATTTGFCSTVKQTSDARLRSMQQSGSGLTGIPTDVCVVWLPSAMQTGQRARFVLWPTPAGTYTLTYRYTANQNRMDAEHPYPLGGPGFAAVVERACIAAGEMILRDSGVSGPLYAEFVAEAERYRQTEANQTAPDSLGYNSDPSAGDWFANPRSASLVSYEGVFYD